MTTSYGLPLNYREHWQAHSDSFPVHRRAQAHTADGVASFLTRNPPNLGRSPTRLVWARNDSWGESHVKALR